jgi:Leucine-rich repeat (LRR) protein
MFLINISSLILLLLVKYIHTSTILTQSQLAVWYPNYVNETSLYLGSRQIATLSTNVFVNLNQLQILDLNTNEIVSVQTHGYFRDLTRLEYLYLHQNQIAFIDETTFLGLTKLTHLYLHNNCLIHLVSSNLFSSLVNLELLWLDGNGLKSLHENVFYGLVKLRWLELSNNNLTTIE